MNFGISTVKALSNYSANSIGTDFKLLHVKMKVLFWLDELQEKMGKNFYPKVCNRVFVSL